VKLKDRVAVITGGNSGIGLAIAREFKANGAFVAILGRNPATLESARAELGEDTLAMAGDVRNLADIASFIENVVGRFGAINVLVPAAGIAKFAPADSLSEALFDELSDIHFKGAFFTVQEALPHMPRGSSIVLVSSSPAQSRGAPLVNVYDAAKAAVRSLGRGLASELVARGIRVNTLSPGLTNTPILARDIGLSAEVRDEIAKSLLGQIPMARLGEADDMAKAALYLASDDSSYVTGAELAVDGGLAQL
jgi:NAD(P)-dependent dehydrogenase (short-subunit alcohol dehydrogenase family)